VAFDNGFRDKIDGNLKEAMAAAAGDAKIQMRKLGRWLFTAGGIRCASSAIAQSLPDAIAEPGEAPVLTLHAEGAQVYECKADPAGRLVWEFREPVATLIEAGKTVGRHYAGPHWEHADGSVIAAKLAGRAPGASASDIPLLKLKVTERRGNGVLSGVTTVQRINTRGGAVEGPCAAVGAHLSVPYAADYVFLRKRS